MMAKRVLITGMGGFAGHYLAQEMTMAGYEVHGLGNADLRGPHVYVADLRDGNTMREIVRRIQPTHVVHLAAISFVAHDNLSEIYETNIIGSRNLLQALSELDTAPERVMLTSSANIYGNSEKVILTEHDLPNPANDYAVSKIAMEYMARQYMSRLNITIIRPFNYTGVGQASHFVIPKIVSHFRSGAQVLELGNIDISRDFSDVRTIVSDMRALLGVPTAVGQVYNLCSGKAYSLKYIIEICERLTGHHLEIRVNPAFVRSNEVKTLIGSPAKLQAALGRSADFGYELEDTLAWMLGA